MTMKRVRYDGEELIMLDEVADGFIRYALALGQRGGVDVVTVPTLTVSGASQTVQIYLNPSIHLSSRPIDEPQDDRHPTAAFLAELELRSAGVETSLSKD
ncbi:hypothetical protein [Naasia lichenicola]|uniref:Uncharacterized protein n=1 Tax=Naasia lichenicola TaxID=2565933 RepID=A0A4S4FJP0_9MICO|nr:hypothetical protein [Naasia lichenicola]THG30072.1 hypothetical protein E6C64_15665 [Naasia lichenicola]